MERIRHCVGSRAAREDNGSDREREAHRPGSRNQPAAMYLEWHAASAASSA
jgi:hypothetical protein